MKILGKHLNNFNKVARIQSFKCCFLIVLRCFEAVCSYHITYAFQSESTLYICLNVKKLLARVTAMRLEPTFTQCVNKHSTIQLNGLVCLYEQSVFELESCCSLCFESVCFTVFNSEKLFHRTTSIKFFFFFCFYFGFLSRTLTNHRTVGEGGGHFFISSLPLPLASQTLRHQQEDQCRKPTSTHIQQPDSNREPLVSEIKSSTYYFENFLCKGKGTL